MGSPEDAPHPAQRGLQAAAGSTYVLWEGLSVGWRPRFLWSLPPHRMHGLLSPSPSPADLPQVLLLPQLSPLPRNHLVMAPGPPCGRT